MTKIDLDQAYKLAKEGQKITVEMLTEEAIQEWKETLRFLCAEPRQDILKMETEDIYNELRY